MKTDNGKWIVRMIAVAVCLQLSVFSSQFAKCSAQNLSIGAKGGINLQDISFDKDDFESSNRMGFFVGPTARIQLPLQGLGADISALYERKESKVNGENIKQESVVIPLNARLQFGISEGAGIYIAAGPQVAFNVGKDEFKWDDKDSYTNTFELKKSTFSVNLGAGIFLSKHFEIGGTYNVAMGRTADATWKDSVKFKGKAKTWTISATYFF